VNLALDVRPGPTYLVLEQKRTEAKRQYKEEQAYIASHRGPVSRLLEEKGDIQVAAGLAGQDGREAGGDLNDIQVDDKITIAVGAVRTRSCGATGTGNHNTNALKWLGGWRRQTNVPKL